MTYLATEPHLLPAVRIAVSPTYGAMAVHPTVNGEWEAWPIVRPADGLLAFCAGDLPTLLASIKEW